ncbi:MAG: hypothetical protein RSA48_01285 [Bacilli bacterium]
MNNSIKEVEIISSESIGSSLVLSLNSKFKTKHMNNKISPAKSLYYIKDKTSPDSELIGYLIINSSLNRSNYQVEGHIVYRLIDKAINQGYEEAVLRSSLAICQELQKEEVLVIANMNNIKELEAITEFGGKLENTVITKKGDKLGRFWIEQTLVTNKVKQK